LSHFRDGAFCIWVDLNAKQAAARERYAHRFCRANQRLTATGYNLVNLGGI
jgi:hypothetical protein